MKTGKFVDGKHQKLMAPSMKRAVFVDGAVLFKVHVYRKGLFCGEKDRILDM